MAEIVMGIGVPHNPMAPKQVLEEGPTSETGALYRKVAEQVESVEPDLLVVFDSDHFVNFFFDNFPAFCIGVVDETWGPDETRVEMPRYTVRVHEAFARSLLEYALACEFDVASKEEMVLDHSILVPLHFLTPSMHIPIVPIFINGVVHPLPAARRCYALGQMVSQAVAALPGSARVAVLGSGSFSLDVGGPLAPRGAYSGVPDPAWVTTILGHLRSADLDALLNEATSQRLATAGNVAGELLNWIAMLGVVGDRQPRFLEPQMEHGHAYGVWRWD
jgi:protocatechuate 4,5-dioxygenase beta chain